MAPASERHGRIQAELGYLLTAHLRARSSTCSVAMNPGVVPRVRSADNHRIPDLGITCVSLPSDSSMPEPVALIEILSPNNETETRSNIWAYTTIPSVTEIILLRSTSIQAEILHRNPDGTWPSEPQIIGADGDLILDSIGFTAPLRAAYRTAGL